MAVAERPNILLIMTDQQRADSPGYTHTGLSDTPNLDRLAQQGVIFDNAYSSATSCVPARASLMTGLLHHRVPKVSSNARAETTSGLALKEGYWTIAHGLRQAGYQTALLGKMHFQPIRASHGFEIAHHCEHLPAGYPADAVDDYHLWLESTDHKDKRFVKPSQPRVFPYPAEYHPTNWVTRHGLDFLANRDRSRPYFAVVSYPHPHTPYDPPEPYASMYPPEKEPFPPTGYEVNDTLPWPFRDAARPAEKGAIFSPKLVRDMPEMHVKRVLASIRALIRHIDDNIGELLKAVDLSNTVVFFLSDHGDYGGHRGFLGKLPWIPFDDLVRVPFVAAGAGVKPGRRINAPVQSFDYVPTAMELAGASLPSRDMDSHSLADVLAGGEPDYQRAVYSSTTEGWPMLRQDRYKQVWHTGADVHLIYDMQADPIESNNLGCDPAWGDFIVKNRKTLRDLLNKPTPDIWVHRPPPEPETGEAIIDPLTARPRNQGQGNAD